MAFHLKMTGTSCTDDAGVKVPSFQRVTFSLQYKILEMSPIGSFVYMKMFLNAVIKDEQTSSDLLQSDSSLLLRNSMMTNTSSS